MKKKEKRKEKIWSELIQCCKFKCFFSLPLIYLLLSREFSGNENCIVTVLFIRCCVVCASPCTRVCVGKQEKLQLQLQLLSLHDKLSPQSDRFRDCWGFSSFCYAQMQTLLGFQRQYVHNSEPIQYICIKQTNKQTK